MWRRGSAACCRRMKYQQLIRFSGWKLECSFEEGRMGDGWELKVEVAKWCTYGLHEIKVTGVEERRLYVHKKVLVEVSK